VNQLDLAWDGISIFGGVAYFAITFAKDEPPVYRRIMKRYSQFRELASQLQRLACDLGMSDKVNFSDGFPRKHFFWCTGKRLERRRSKLESWLRMVLQEQDSFPEMRSLLWDFLYEESSVMEPQSCDQSLTFKFLGMQSLAWKSSYLQDYKEGTRTPF
jgi:hypothetical protein